MGRFLSCLQHSRPCCIGYTNCRLRLEFVYPIQHGRSCCKHYKFFLPMITPKSNPSEHYKHFRKAVAFPFRKLELCRHCRFRAGSFSGLSSRIQVSSRIHICHVDRHGHFTLKELRLPVLNESHTNSYTGPRL